MSDRREKLLLLFVILFLSSCSLLQNSDLLTQQKSDIELKKKNYNTLLEHIKGTSLAKGSPADMVEKTYGKPDDIFHSASSESSFDVWTYEKVLTAGDNNWQPIRLYFNNGKLLNWNY